MNHGQIEWTEILVEGEVREIVVDVKEESILVVLWRFHVGHPV